MTEMVAERLARVDVAHVHLDGGQIHRRDGVAQGVGVVGQRAGVDQDAVGPIARGVDRVNQRALVVRLEDTQLDPRLIRRRLQHRVDLVQRRAAIDARLARAEQVQVRSV